MSADNVIMYMICGCILFAIAIIFFDKFKTAGKFIFKGVIGTVSIYIINYIFSPLGIFVGINMLTFVVAGILGVPGIISLYIINAFL